MIPCACHLVAGLLHSRKNILMNLARLEARGGTRGTGGGVVRALRGKQRRGEGPEGTGGGVGRRRGGVGRG